MTTSQQKTLFLVGPGFIGGSLLVRLREARPDLALSALTRREEQAQELASLGITPVRGSLEDVDVIKEHASHADIVIHAATADDAPSAFAIVDGLKQRKDKSKKAVYIHTSGNDELLFSAKQLKGQSVEARTLSDVKGDAYLEADRIDPKAWHRHVDGPLREQLFNDAAEKEHNVSATIMMPPLIYGIGSPPWKRHSIQVPMLVECMMKQGTTITLDPSSQGCWNAVWVHDLVEAYLVLLQQLEAHTPGTSQPSHYCFPGEPVPFLWKDLLDAASEETLAQAGVGLETKKVIPDRKTFEEFVGGKSNPYSPAFGAIVFGDDNSYTRPDRLTQNGFKFRGKGVIDSIKNGGELKEVLAKLKTEHQR